MLMISFMIIFQIIILKLKDLDVNIINCCFDLADIKFKQYMINNISHILKTNNHQIYNEIEYCLVCLLIRLVGDVMNMVLNMPHLVRTTIENG